MKEKNQYLKQKSSNSKRKNLLFALFSGLLIIAIAIFLFLKLSKDSLNKGISKEIISFPEKNLANLNMKDTDSDDFIVEHFTEPEEYTYKETKKNYFKNNNNTAVKETKTISKKDDKKAETTIIRKKDDKNTVTNIASIKDDKSGSKKADENYAQFDSLVNVIIEQNIVLVDSIIKNDLSNDNTLVEEFVVNSLASDSLSIDSTLIDSTLIEDFAIDSSLIDNNYAEISDSDSIAKQNLIVKEIDSCECNILKIEPRDKKRPKITWVDTLEISSNMPDTVAFGERYTVEIIVEKRILNSTGIIKQKLPDNFIFIPSKELVGKYCIKNQYLKIKIDDELLKSNKISYEIDVQNTPHNYFLIRGVYSQIDKNIGYSDYTEFFNILFIEE